MLSRRLLALAAAAFIPLVALRAYGLYTEGQENLAKARESVLRLARQASERHERLLARTQALAETLTTLSALQDGDWPTVNEILEGAVRRFPEYPNMRVSALDGSTVASARPNDPVWSNRGLDWFNKVVQTGHSAVSNYFIGQGTRKPSVSIGYPVQDEQGRITHVLSVTIDLTDLAEFSPNEIPSRTAVMLIGRSGSILAQGPGRLPPRGREVDPDLLAALQSGEPEGVVDGDLRDFGPSIIAFVALPVAPQTEALYVAVAVPRSQVLAPVSRAMFLNAGVVVLIVAFVFGAGTAASRRLVLTPVQTLLGVMEQLAAGNLSARAPQSLQADGSEFGRLAQALNALGARLESREADHIAERERLRAIFDAYFGVAVLVSPAHIIEEVNETSLRLTGLSREDVVGRPFTGAAWFSDANAEYVTQLIDRAFGGESVRVVATAVLPRLGQRLIDTAFAPIRNRAGEVVLVVGFGMDITERSRTEVALRESESRLREAQRVARLGNWELDISSGRLHWSDEIFRIFEIDGRFDASFPAFLDVVHPDDREMVDHVHTTSLRSGQPYRIVYRLLMPDGRAKHVEDQCETIYADDGTPLRSLGTVQDITEHVRVEEALRASEATLEQRVIDRTRELEASNRELEAFSYAVSHDLRAPLRAIDGFSQTLLEDEADRLSETGRADLLRIRGAAQRMGDLIDAMLQLSRLLLEPMDIATVDLSALASQVADEMQEAHAPRDVHVQISPGLSVRGDRRLLRAALTNLLGNAFKFTSRVPVARIEMGSMELDGERVYFIRDNGAGFDMAYADKLFVPFERLHKVNEFPGTGVGLTTVQRIVHRHGGRIWANSQPGKGATFYFVLDRT